MSTNALHSLYGGKQARNALSGNVGGQARKQEVWTPEWILAAARQAMGGIQLDPCGATAYESEVRVGPKVNPITGGWFADITLVQPGACEGLQTSPHGGTLVSLDGKSQDWSQAKSTFVNPEFADLEAWLTHASLCGQRGGRTTFLSPVRTHRRWWLPTIRSTGGEIVFLDYRVKFKGHESAFPAPLCLITWNCRLPDLGARETGRW